MAYSHDVLQDFEGIAERNPKKEVQLVIVRFFSVLMSQSRSSKDAKGDEGVSWFYLDEIEGFFCQLVHH